MNTESFGPGLVLLWDFTTYMDPLHADSAVENEEGPVPKSKSLLLAHRTELCQCLENRIRYSDHLIFFCNLTCLLSCASDSNDESKVEIQIWGFLTVPAEQEDVRDGARKMAAPFA
jgi:hypothetical protein